MIRAHPGGPDCWCKPRLTLLCVICLGSEAGCEACTNGWREVDRAEFDDSEQPGVVICRDIREES